MESKRGGRAKAALFGFGRAAVLELVAHDLAERRRRHRAHWDVGASGRCGSCGLLFCGRCLLSLLLGPANGSLAGAVRASLARFARTARIARLARAVIASLLMAPLPLRTVPRPP